MGHCGSTGMTGVTIGSVCTKLQAAQFALSLPGRQKTANVATEHPTKPQQLYQYKVLKWYIFYTIRTPKNKAFDRYRSVITEAHMGVSLKVRDGQ